MFQIRSRDRVAKFLGTLFCIGRAMLMTLSEGIPLKLWSSPFNLSVGKKTSHFEDLTKASLLVISSCLCWSTWFII